MNDSTKRKEGGKGHGVQDRLRWALYQDRLHDLNKAAFKNLMVIVDEASRWDGTCYPSRLTLASLTTMSERNVTRGLNDLISAGIIRVEVSGKKNHASTIYRLMGYFTGYRLEEAAEPDEDEEIAEPDEDEEAAEPDENDEIDELAALEQVTNLSLASRGASDNLGMSKGQSR